MLRLFTFALFGAAVCITTASAGPDRVALPDYRSNDFVRYMIVDRPDRKRARFMYVNRPGFDAACQRRSKISPPGRSKTSPLNVMRYAVLGGCPGSP